MAEASVGGLLLFSARLVWQTDGKWLTFEANQAIQLRFTTAFDLQKHAWIATKTKADS